MAGVDVSQQEQVLHQGAQTRAYCTDEHRVAATKLGSHSCSRELQQDMAALAIEEVTIYGRLLLCMDELDEERGSSAENR